jgi:hypothetical protein
MKLELLLKTYVELAKLHAIPGERSHMLACQIAFIQKLIKFEAQKDKYNEK